MQTPDLLPAPPETVHNFPRALAAHQSCAPASDTGPPPHWNSRCNLRLFLSQKLYKYGRPRQKGCPSRSDTTFDHSSQLLLEPPPCSRSQPPESAVLPPVPCLPAPGLLPPR